MRGLRVKTSVEKARQNEGDAAWRAYIWRSCGAIDAPEMNETELRQRFGEPSWNVVLYESVEEQRGAEAQIRQYDAGHNLRRTDRF